MLNPSTADATTDDATVLQCKAFAVRWGFAKLRVVNLWPIRATDPAQLATWDWRADRGHLAENDHVIRDEITRSRAVVFAWGANAAKVTAPWPSPLRDLARSLPNVPLCLGTNRDGSPKHPLYLKLTTQPRVWDSGAHAAFGAAQWTDDL